MIALYLCLKMQRIKVYNETKTSCEYQLYLGVCLHSMKMPQMQKIQ